MPIEKVVGTSLEYYLICIDEKGKESSEDGELLSQKLLDVLGKEPITDVFVMSHGWQGDVPAAKKQYQHWIAAMAAATDDIQNLKQKRHGFLPLLIGLHWPSKPWGNENLDAPPAFDTEDDSLNQLIEEYAHQVSDTEATREALRVIFAAGFEYDTPPEQLPPEVRAAYQVLIHEASSSNVGEENSEWEESEPLNIDPDSVYEASLTEVEESSEISFGIGDSIAKGWDKFLNVPRLLSFWKMKDLARQIGQTSGFDLLTKMQQVADSNVRFHLMGHSFGTIVVSAIIAGTNENNQLVRPIDSLALIQGAVSLWSYSAKVPFRNNLQGYFYPIVRDRKVKGPIITTQSSEDTAVKNAYPAAGTLGMAGGQDIDFDVTTPKYPGVGGIGVYGIQGEGLDITNIDMLSKTEVYDFQPGKIYNLESSKYITVPNPDLFTGAHNAIDKSEVAHAVWSAALVS
ncbi:hypothetical protein H6G54_18895 [Anabaena cylindrica FACHB-243]|uniref:Uncharacterized protein n=1 Tax=Anabaena cylindrica (strain ATCC 27899 / PCC 7122) TaxID=272123 RepID=K9ZFB2_ANACC|nr:MULTISPECIES: hypothetical protein [Anabaena]AFZ57908.1 hypothetical protein Anacy_2459 [Anabaena cylindrica PCC 7122]MBD2419737.1 hypothetical protein [Anabaena cylindrica FACHB-243]MBY5281560.1 hypothetical protein [Anabaena sp. CCAP 1446/1C]MBY5307187.1 hypothetical protein [Anabaena sp. CCAP 1446/1C]MCM2405550.1 hypothetical protein [Anabaena sp. CCAP 1446/1C]